MTAVSSGSDSREAIERWAVAPLASSIRAGSLRAIELLEHCRDRVEAADASLRAFVHLDWKSAEQEAAAVDRAVARGEELGPLAGIPFGVKDSENCAGMPTRHGSRLQDGAPAAGFDDPHVARLRAAGAIPIGKTALPEFMSGLLTESKAFGVTANPWNPEVTPGGSSGGSAAVVASGMVPFATGSDGGGSLRIPAAFCGLVGLKTSLGAIPLLERDVSMTNCEGVLTCDVASTALLVELMAGPIERDPVSYIGLTPVFRQDLSRRDLSGMRVAYAPFLGGAGAAPDVEASCREAFERVVTSESLSVIGAEVASGVDCEVLNMVFIGAGSANAWGVLAPGDLEVRSDEMTDYFADRMDRAGQVTMREFACYHLERDRLRARWTTWFDEIDAIMWPTVSTCDVPAGGPAPTVVSGQAFEGAAAVCPLTRIANLMGAPAVSVPVGFADNGVPIGMHVMTRFHADGLALRLGSALQAHEGPRRGWNDLEGSNGERRRSPSR